VAPTKERSTAKETNVPSLGGPEKAPSPKKCNQSTQPPHRHCPTSNVATVRDIISTAIIPSELTGMTLNPDTGRLTEYRQLATSSIGAKWQLVFCKGGDGNFKDLKRGEKRNRMC
jgi:hypothetical protein